MSNTNETTKYFDLHTTGCGFLSRARKVSPKKGQPYFAVTVAASRGEASEKLKTYFDVQVVGADAKAFVEEHLGVINDRNRKVFVSFKIGDIYAETFTYSEGHEKAGQTGVSLKGRLLQLRYAKIDGEVVIHRADDTPDSAPAAEPESPETLEGEFLPAEARHSQCPRFETDDQVLTDPALPETVRLDKDAPDFEQRKAELKAQGYRFDSAELLWRKAA